MNNPKFIFFSYAATGQGISGSDRIFLEFARCWKEKYQIQIFTSPEGKFMADNLKVFSTSNLSFNLVEFPRVIKFLFVTEYISKIACAIFKGLTVKLDNKFIPGVKKQVVLYSCSDFLMDVLPAFILKLRYPSIKWIAGWYQTSPNPLIGYTEGRREKRYRFKSLLFWFSQLISKPLIKTKADYILVNNEGEKNQFEDKKVIVVLGGVDLSTINYYRRKYKKLPKVYDAVFQGRFHPQKGVLELIDIWKLVTIKKPKAKLALIGNGPLMDEVKQKVDAYKLTDNIDFLGYLFDGEPKYKVISQSRIVVHPSFYDSGGMAAMEAMVFGLPCIGFNLKSYEFYYPTGMVKVSLGHLEKFSEIIVNYLTNKKLMSRAERNVRSIKWAEWSWTYRSSQVIDSILKL